MSTRRQYKGAEVGMSSRACNSKRCVFRLTANWRYEYHYTVVSSRCSGPPRRIMASRIGL